MNTGIPIPLTHSNVDQVFRDSFIGVLDEQDIFDTDEISTTVTFKENDFNLELENVE